RWQNAVQRASPTGRSETSIRKVDVGALSQSVNTGIGPPGAMHPHRRAANLSKCPFELILHRFAMTLALPAFECRAVVSDNKFQSLRHFGSARFFVRRKNFALAIEIAL